MKTLRLTKSESAAYANGERRFWRAIHPSVPETANYGGMNGYGQHIFYPIEDDGFDWPDGEDGLRRCVYGSRGEILFIKTTYHVTVSGFPITAITVEQRDGKWGWLVEVGA